MHFAHPYDKILSTNLFLYKNDLLSNAKEYVNIKYLYIIHLANIYIANKYQICNFFNTKIIVGPLSNEILCELHII